MNDPSMLAVLFVCVSASLLSCRLAGLFIFQYIKQSAVVGLNWLKGLKEQAKPPVHKSQKELDVDTLSLVLVCFFPLL